jgi:hypothetical protein
MATAEPVEASVHPTAEGSAWAPFHSPTFAAMCSAQFVSNVGGWFRSEGHEADQLPSASASTRSFCRASYMTLAAAT